MCSVTGRSINYLAHPISIRFVTAYAQCSTPSSLHFVTTSALARMRTTLKKLALLVSLAFSSATVFSADLTPEKQQQYGQAYGSVQGFALSMDYMRDNCGDTAKDSRKIWDARNAVQKVQADVLFQKVMRLIAKQSGEKAAKEAEPQIRQQFAQMQGQAVKNSFAKFAALPPDQKAAACARFAAEVRAGGWDIQKKAPALFEFLATESL